MIRLFHVTTDAAVEVNPDELDAVRRRDGWWWLDVVDADEPTTEQVCGDLGFDRVAAEDVLSRTELPKADDYADHTLTVLHGVADDDTRFRTVEYDSFVGPGYLVVFRSEELAGLRWVRDQLTVPGHQPPMGPDRAFAVLVEAGASRFNVLADALENRVEELEERAFAGDPAVISEVQALRRDAVKLRRVLAPQRDTIQRLGTDDFPALDERARMRLRSAADQYSRAVESVDASRSLLAAVLDTYRAVVAERANEVMKVLAVFAAILLPLSVIAGVYGMNFSHMPELAWRWAYFATLGLMATIAVSLWLYFARRGFIGGPRLSRIPKAVGAGLAGLVRLTVQPVDVVGRIIIGRRRSE